MTTIQGVRIHPGFFKQQRRKPVEHRVGDAPASIRLKPTSIPKPRAPRAKYAMPAVAIIGAIGSFVAGAGIALAAEATVAAMVVGGAMMVGAAMTVVGTITGNQKLAKWGTVLSVVGGIGALGLGAAGMLTDAAASTATSTAPGVAANGSLTVDGAGLASETGDAVMNAANASEINNAAAGAAGSGAPAAAVPPPTPTPAPASGMVTAPTTNPDGTVLATDAPATAAANAPSATPPAVSATPSAGLPAGAGDTQMNPMGQGTGMLDMPTPGSVTNVAPPKIDDLWAGYETTANGTKAPQPGLWKQFQSWYKDNPDLAKTLSSTVQGAATAMSPMAGAQTDYIKANTNLARANAAAADENTYRMWLRTYYNQGKMPPAGATPSSPR